MERHNKANAFRDKGVPGDPRLLDAVSRRTPNVANGGLNHVFGSTIITAGKSRRGLGSHPWRAISNGDTVINIAKGRVYGFRGSGDIDPTPLYAIPASYAGGKVTVTTATGYIYAKISTTESTISSVVRDEKLFNTVTQMPGAITCVFSESDPLTVSDGVAGEVWLPIAEVSMTEGIAVVEEQILFHNPFLSVELGRLV